MSHPLTDQEQLEAMVDRLGLQGVLHMLSQVTYEKADHILTVWEDEERSKQWARWGMRLYIESNRAGKSEVTCS